MSKKNKRPAWYWCLIALLVVIGVFAVLAGTYCILRFGFSIDVLDRSGWDTENETVRYLDYYGKPKTCWQTVDGKTYYFAPEDGDMVTDWYTVEEKRYYFGNDGVLATGWLELDGQRYYLAEDGAMTTGWLELDGNRYYFVPENGKMTIGWLELDGNRLYFSGDGVLQTGWVTLEDKVYYFSPDGFAVSGWVELEGVCYYFNDDGSAATGWFEDETGKYYFDEDGHPHSGWLDWEQKRYYLNEDGSITVGWLTLEEARYYFLPTGRMAIGEVEVDGISRFFTSTGKEVMLCNPWHPVPEDFSMDLVDIEGFKIDRAARDPLQQMMNDCRADGVPCRIGNSYRSRATQQAMWDTRISEHMAAGRTEQEAARIAGQTLAIPGHSEHQTGLAFDVAGGRQTYDWLEEHCWDYGFILRYPDDRYDITGIIYEPWHYRYVGTELSLELKGTDLSLEEYMAMLTEQQKEIPD